MTLDPETPEDYLVGHLEDALARDPRVSEQDIHVRVAAGRIFVSGTVPTENRRRAVEEVISELMPGCEIVNEVKLADYPELEDVEQVR